MSGTSLKLAMMILMVFDHIGAFIPVKFQGILHLLTRPVAPVFAYLAIQSYKHTKNRKNYIKRLFISSFIMACGNILANHYIIKNQNYFIYNNIFLTLALGVTSLYLIDEFIKKNKLMLGYIYMVLIFIIGLFAEGGIIIIPFMIITYLLEDDEKLRNIVYVAITIILFKSSFIKYDSWAETVDMLMINSDFLFISAMPFIYLYNGQRGKNSKFDKYLFYGFYPMHLWIIGIIASKIQ